MVWVRHGQTAILSWIQIPRERLRAGENTRVARPPLTAWVIVFDAPGVHHDTIVVPETMPSDQVKALAEQKAQSSVGEDDRVFDIQLGTAHPVGGEHGTEVEWPYTYQVVPPGGSAAERPS
ncbi:hypothetical protein [Mycolicibacterium wolinskyi]|uniref:hypothetical protein n=1 Tax=Mycolicibacterium wolinskyi TaxID=59750 RepID=UPI0039177D5E